MADGPYDSALRSATSSSDCPACEHTRGHYSEPYWGTYDSNDLCEGCNERQKEMTEPEEQEPPKAPHDRAHDERRKHQG